MAIMGDYKDLVKVFFDNEIEIKRKDLKPIEMWGLPDVYMEELAASPLPSILGNLLNINGVIVAYEYNPNKRSFKFTDKNGETIRITMRPNNGEIGISKDGLGKIWNCHRNDFRDFELCPLALEIDKNQISVIRRFQKKVASISFEKENESFCIKLEDSKNKNCFYLIPHEDELINHLILRAKEAKSLSLSEIYGYTSDITGLNLQELNVSIKTTKIINQQNVASKIVIDKGSYPSFSISLPAPNNETINYTITDNENGYVSIMVETICGTKNFLVEKTINSLLTIEELDNFLMEAIKKGKIKRRD